MSCELFRTNELFSHENPTPNEVQSIREGNSHTSKSHHFSKTSKSYRRKLPPKSFPRNSLTRLVDWPEIFLLAEKFCMWSATDSLCSPYPLTRLDIPFHHPAPLDSSNSRTFPCHENSPLHFPRTSATTHRRNSFFKPKTSPVPLPFQSFHLRNTLTNPPHQSTASDQHATQHSKTFPWAQYSPVAFPADFALR
jgi:hypothetical protein